MTNTLDKFLAKHPDIEVFEVLMPDLNGTLRGKWIPRASIGKVLTGDLKLPLSSLGFDIWGRDPAALVFESGDEDGICVADLKTLAPTPWLERPTGQLLVSLQEVSGNPCGYDARTVLSNILSRFNSLGLTPVAASEMEFYLFSSEQDRYGQPIHTQRGVTGETAVGGQTYGIEEMQDMAALMHDIRDASEMQNLPVDTLITEAAPSQYEINLYHEADALLAADQALMLKRVIKGVAKQHSMLASFMAKPFGDLAGNGMHIHCSLVDEKGNNAFDNGTDEGNELLQYAVAGCLATMADSMAIFAPNLNSYRRFQAGSHAPLAPAWGYENRTTALRIPAGSHKAMRIEHRVAGADANPYLTIAVILAGMLYGIENKLVAPPATVGDAYSQHPPSLPRYWPDALEKFQNSEFIRDYLGAELQQVYSISKQQEMDQFSSYVSPLEYNAYL